MEQGNSNHDPMAGLMTRMARSYILAMIGNVFNEISTNFEWITGLISQGGQLVWKAILLACRLSMEVSRQTSMSMVNIILDGGANRFRLLKEATKKAGMTILTVGKTVRHVFTNYLNEDPDAFDLISNLSRYVPLDPNVNLQDVLDPILNRHQETEPAEEHSNQSSSGYGTPDDGPEKTEPSDSEEHSNQSSSGERTSNEKSEETEASEEHSNQSGSGQKSSNEESEETEPEEEHSNQGYWLRNTDSNQYSSGQRTSNEESEETEPSEEHLYQSTSGQKISNEQSEETESSEEEHSDQSSSGEKDSNEESEETKSSEEHLNQSNSGFFRWIPYEKSDSDTSLD